MKVSPFESVCDEEHELDLKLEKRKRELSEVIRRIRSSEFSVIGKEILFKFNKCWCSLISELLFLALERLLQSFPSLAYRRMFILCEKVKMCAKKHEVCMGIVCNTRTTL